MFLNALLYANLIVEFPHQQTIYYAFRHRRYSRCDPRISTISHVSLSGACPWPIHTHKKKTGVFIAASASKARHTVCGGSLFPQCARSAQCAFQPRHIISIYQCSRHAIACGFWDEQGEHRQPYNNTFKEEDNKKEGLVSLCGA